MALWAMAPSFPLQSYPGDTDGPVTLRARAQIAKDKRFLYHPRPFAHQGVSALTYFTALAPYNGPPIGL